MKYSIPVGALERACASCKATIYWIVTDAKRRMPVNPDGTSHFATCPNASKHRKRGKQEPEQLELLGRPK